MGIKKEQGFRKSSLSGKYSYVDVLILLGLRGSCNILSKMLHDKGTITTSQEGLMEEKTMSTAIPIRDAQQVRALQAHFLENGNYRNGTLVIIAIHTALRISDILSLRVWDVYDIKTHRALDTLTLIEQKTGKSKSIALHSNVREALELQLATATDPNAPLIINERTGKAISRVQAYRIIRGAAEAVEIPHRVCCHSLRKTFGYHAWKKGTPSVVLMDIFNHSSYSTTKRYLGITQDDKNSVYLNLDI